MLHAGMQRFTADGAVSSSGAAVIVYSVVVRATGTATEVILNNGTSTAGDDLDTINAAANTTTVHNFERGLIFPSGCFVDVDANTSYAVVVYEKV